MKHLIVIAAVLVTAAPARAQSDGAAMLGKAQKAIDDVDYDTARTLTDQALASGSLHASELARAHMLAGEVAAAVGNDSAAHDHFERWLALAPDAQLPPGLSPKIMGPFEAARADVRKLGATRLDVTIDRKKDKTSFAVTGDPLELVARVHVALAAGGEGNAVGTRVDVVIADDVAGVATLTLLDEQGNQVAELSRTLEVRAHAAAAAAEPGTHATGHRVPAALRWPTWTAVTVIAGGAAGDIARLAAKDHDARAPRNPASPLHSVAAARARGDRGKRDSLYTNVSLGVAIAAAAATIVTFAVDSHDVEVRPLAAPGAAGASATLHF